MRLHNVETLLLKDFELGMSSIPSSQEEASHSSLTTMICYEASIPNHAQPF
jgi:hypothetical protein